MSQIKGLGARVRSLFGARSSESRMEEEFRFHVEMETTRLVEREGLSPAEARRRALVAFGGLDTHREAMRDGRGARWLDDLIVDRAICAARDATSARLRDRRGADARRRDRRQRNHLRFRRQPPLSARFPRATRPTRRAVQRRHEEQATEHGRVRRLSRLPRPERCVRRTRGE